MKGLIKLAIFLCKKIWLILIKINHIFAHQNMANFFPIWLNENIQFSQFG